MCDSNESALLSKTRKRKPFFQLIICFFFSFVFLSLSLSILYDLYESKHTCPLSSVAMIFCINIEVVSKRYVFSKWRIEL
ncbi:hypothetical protein Q502_10300 [Mesotoga sp. Brook.08.YT.4.2.5.2.]|nr:hypothetical protein Q502_10300 [Mesotoga sp. Brook.08.YT.4.2.5.2.]